jgi:hypothetical protein
MEVVLLFEYHVVIMYLHLHKHKNDVQSTARHAIHLQFDISV